MTLWGGGGVGWKADTGENTGHEKGRHLESSIAHDPAEVWLRRVYYWADTGENTRHEKGRHLESSIAHDLSLASRVYCWADTGENAGHEKGRHLESSIAHDLAEVWLRRVYIIVPTQVSRPLSCPD